MSKYLPIPALFALTIVVIVYFMPRESKDEYSYTENTPWMYGLLTAPFNFHIQKSDTQIQAEKDSILQRSNLYYTLNKNVDKFISKQITDDLKGKEIPKSYLTYLDKQLETIYSTGVIGIDDLEQINSKGKKQIMLKEKTNTVAPRSISSFYTPKQAYELILNNAPLWVNISVLKDLNLNSYLVENVEYDENTTNKDRESAISNISLIEGKVLSGQKIIDRGDIVDTKTKNILDSYTREMQEKVDVNMKTGWLLIGQIILVSLLFIGLMFYLKFYRPDIYTNRKNVIFILIMAGIMPVIAGLMGEVKMYNQLYVLPLAIPTILLRTFLDSRTAFTAHIVVVLTCTLVMPIESMAQFIFIEIFAGYMCILSLRRLSERSQLVYCSILIFANYVVSYTGWLLFTDGYLNFDLLAKHREIYFLFCLNFVFISFAYILIYFFERIFGFISEISMVELSNTNKPLLQELSEIAPGTFQHSMQVSNLVVSAANKIGANATLVRTGALYHDIGKMVNPIYFTENQPSDFNPHKYMTCQDSARMIISHVEEGVKLAKKHNLPQQIIDFIQTHHGKGRTGYFYNQYKNEHPDEDVDPKPFEYPGPNPFSKETAILMMADTVEAASRSLKENTKESITALVNKLIDQQVADGLLKNAPLTFKDIEDVKEVFCEKLVSMRHVRVAYPELKEKTKTDKV